MGFTHIVSTIIVLIIFYGLWKRKDVKAHVPAMLLAFGLDVALVLYIELNKGAIEQFATDVQSPTGHELLLFHISVSLITVVLYIILTVLGFKILKGERALLKLHRNLGGVFLICRLTNYVTSFMIGA
ncbi:MAG: hypothetical protein AB7P76_04165 [Candidatus Melainabacteria bacterium]